MKQRNWKTTSAGVGTLLTALGAAATAYAEQGAAGIDWASLVPAIIASIGLILAADGGKG